jgi:hypothetical protein
MCLCRLYVLCSAPYVAVGFHRYCTTTSSSSSRTPDPQSAHTAQPQRGPGAGHGRGRTTRRYRLTSTERDLSDCRASYKILHQTGSPPSFDYCTVYCIVHLIHFIDSLVDSFPTVTSKSRLSHVRGSPHSGQPQHPSHHTSLLQSRPGNSRCKTQALRASSPHDCWWQRALCRQGRQLRRHRIRQQIFL